MNLHPLRYILLTNLGTTILGQRSGRYAMTRFARKAGGRNSILWALALLAAAVPAFAQDRVTVSVESIETSADAHPEVSIQNSPSGEAPTAMVLFFAFDASRLSPDPTYYETIARDALGNVQVDDNGEAIVFRSAVRPTAALTGAGKAITTQVYAEGVIGIVISGINETPIPTGTMFTLGFETQPGVSSTATTVLRGITSDTSVQVTNPTTGATETARSSAVSLDNGVEIPVTPTFFGGTILFSCPGDIPAVTGVTASTNDPDSVVLSWTSGSSLEYRVYRSDNNNFAQAVALGAGWQLAKTFSDFSAAPGVPGNAGGCFGGSDGTAINQFYWVISRDSSRCESDPVGPTQGSRLPEAAKAVGSSAASVTPMGEWMVMALVAGVLAVASIRRRTARA
jgi:hypothetical protein